MKLFRIMSAVALGAALGACVATVSDSQFFYRDPPDRGGARVEGLAYETVPYDCGVVSVARKNTGAGSGVLVYFGGNQFRIADNASAIAEKAAQAGFGEAVMFDYPGRGETTGDIMPDCFVAASKAVASQVRRTVGPDADVVAVGFSFGGFMLANASQAYSGFRAVVLESTARSPESWMKAMAPAGMKIRIPPSMQGFDSAKALQSYRGPILVLTGSADTTAGPAVARDLVAALEQDHPEIASLIVPHATHGGALASPEGMRALGRLRLESAVR